MSDDEERLRSLTIIADSIRDRLVMQLNSIERLETKGVILLGFAVAAAQFVLLADNLNPWWRGVALAVYAAAFVEGLVVVAPREYAYPPDPRYLFDTYIAKPPADVLIALARARTKALETTIEPARKKARAYRWTLRLLVVAVMLSAIARVAGSSDDRHVEPRSGTTPSTTSSP